jgi:hypothetical protein
MNTRQQKPVIVRSLYIFFVLGMLFAGVGGAEAYARLPFLGHWQAVDADGSYMLLDIGGPPDGPFRITWVDDYMTFCSGEAGIIRGTGVINELNVSLLEADLVAECFTTGDSLSFHMTFRYHPLTRTLSSQYENGRVIIWRRSGVAPAIPALNLRINYGDDWVESFYTAEHTAWVTVTESDGWTVKATAEVVTAPRDEWGGESGFQTTPENWSPGQPDIQAGDWVYGWVDNGASAQVQIGEISGKISTTGDFITGTILAPWFSSDLDTECHPWGSPEPVDMKYDWVYPDGEDTYTCSWAGAWDIQPGEQVGVGYSGPDGHWVANSFYAPNPRIVASESGDWFWTSGFYPGMVEATIYETDQWGAALLWTGWVEADESGFAFVGRDIHAQDLVPGNYLVVSDGVNAKGVVLQPISVTIFDTENEIMAGYAPAGSEVWAAAGAQEWQERLMAPADPETGWWWADFTSIGFDIQEEYRGWSYAHIYDEDGDANEGSTPPPPPPLPQMMVWIEWNSVDTDGWGTDEYVTLTIGEVVLTEYTGDGTYVHFELGATHDILPGDLVRLTNDVLTKELLLPPLGITDYDLGANTISGTYDPALAFSVYADGQPPIDVSFAGNTWTATFAELLPLQWGDAVQTDADNDAAAATIRTPDPTFYVVPEENEIWAVEWSPGQLLTVTVNGVEAASQVVPYAGSPYGQEVMFDLDSVGVDILAGDSVVLSDGRSTEELIVALVEVTDYDPATQTISGIATPGDLLVSVNGVDIWVTVGEAGNWSVSSAEYDPGEWGSAIIWDGDGEQTRDIFIIP